MIRLSFILLLGSLLTTSHFVSIIDAEPIRKNAGYLDKATKQNRRTTIRSSTTTPTTQRRESISAGLAVALFIICLFAVILIFCGLFWLVSRFRDRRRAQAWEQVYESVRPFPTKKSRYANDKDDETAWRGPAPYEIRMPFSVDPSDTRVDTKDPSTILELDDASAAVSEARSSLYPTAASLESLDPNNRETEQWQALQKSNRDEKQVIRTKDNGGVRCELVSRID